MLRVSRTSMNAPLRGTGLPNKVCNCPAGACPRRALTNLSGSSIQTHQAPKTVIARSAATWQSVPPQCERIAPAARPVMPPGRYGAPAGALQPYGLQRNGLPHQRARWFAMTDLRVQRIFWEARGFREAGGGVTTPPYGTGFGSASVPTHLPRSCTRRVGACPRRAPGNPISSRAGALPRLPFFPSGR